jgi:hypothetical protein
MYMRLDLVFEPSLEVLDVNKSATTRTEKF